MARGPSPDPVPPPEVIKMNVNHVTLWFADTGDDDGPKRPAPRPVPGPVPDPP